VADFEFHVDYECGHATTEFINKSTNADTFLWDKLGNGYFQEIYQPRGSNMTSNKKWIVTLIAKGNGLSDTISKEVEVFNTKIKFDKTVSDSGLYAPLHVDFINQSEIREDDEVSFYWNFGDGQFSEESATEHVYVSPGTYYVVLYGYKSDGCELQYSDYVIVKDTTQKNEFGYIVSRCSTTPCIWNEPHIIESFNFILNKIFLRNDSLILSGITGQNCCTYKTFTMVQENDTIFIHTWETGPLCTCIDDYYFEIVLPPTDKDSITLSFNNEIVKTVITGVSNLKKNSEINIYPNPVKDILMVDIPFDIGDSSYEYSIADMQGRLLQNGNFKSQSQIKLDFAEKGVFIIHLKGKRDKYNYRFKFIKE
jgi:hypothetical protein